MYFQSKVLKTAGDWPVGESFRDGLPDDGLLIALIIHAHQGAVTNSLNSIEKWRIADYISELKIVGNGSTPIKAYTGNVCHFFQWLYGGGSSPDKAFNYGSSQKRFHSVILFGRHLYDFDYGLDLSKWDSVEMVFTNDAAAAQFTSAWDLDVTGIFLRDAPEGQLKGYFVTEQWRRWTTVRAEEVNLKLPTAHKIRSIVMQVYPEVGSTMQDSTTLYNVLYNIHLAYKTGARDVFDANLRRLWYENYFSDGRNVLRALQPYHTDEYGIRSGLGQILGHAGLRGSHSNTQSSYGTTIIPGIDSSTLVRCVDAETDQDCMILMGLALENCSFFRFDKFGGPETYLDPNVEKTVLLDMTTRDSATADDGTIRVMLDRFVEGQGPYGG